MNELLTAQVTYLKNVKYPEQFKTVTLKEALKTIKNGVFSAGVNKARAAKVLGDDDEYKRLKTALPSYCFHGTFDRAVASANFKSSSGLFHIDVDKLSTDQELAEALNTLKTDPHTVFAYISPSEEGIKSAFRVDPEAIKDDSDFKKAFSAIAPYLSGKGITIDSSCKDVRRVSFVSCDPDLFYNKDPKVFELVTQKALADEEGLEDLTDLGEDCDVVGEDDCDDTCATITLENAAKYLPVAGKQKYQEWLEVGAMLHHQFRGSQEALKMFDTWSQGFDSYDGPEVVEKWKSFKRKDGKVKTFRTLIKAYNEAHPDEKPDTGDWKAALDRHVEKFSRNNAQVMVGGKHKIMWRMNKNEPYEFSDRKQRELMYAHTTIKTGEKEVYHEVKDVFSNHLAAWATHPKTRIYMGGVIFKPNGVSKHCYNTWQGFAVEPVQNDELLTGVYHHIDNVICNGKKDMQKYFYDWSAYSFQNPDAPAMSALVLRGKKGSGKGIMGHFLMKIWGAHAHHISNPKHLVGNFNAHLADCCFLFADEAFYSGDKKHESVLKALITEATITIERKGIDVSKGTNYLKVFMATNEDFAVPASEDERRYAVFDVQDTYIKNTKYFDNLTALHNSKEVQAAFLYAMLERNIANYRPGNIPESDGLLAQRLHSLDSRGKWLADFLTSGDFDAEDQIGACWEPELSSTELYENYIRWCDKQKTNSYDRESQIQLSKYLKEIYPKRILGPSNKRVNGFRLGTLEEAIKSFETTKKISLDI